MSMLLNKTQHLVVSAVLAFSVLSPTQVVAEGVAAPSFELAESVDEEISIVATSIRWQELNDAYLRQQEQESRYRNFLLLASLPFLYYLILHKPKQTKWDNQVTGLFEPKIEYSKEAATFMVGVRLRY